MELRPARSTRQRTLELDILRGFAVFMVMGAHVQAYPIWSTIARYGVDLFFVLSGFLISNLLFREYLETGGIGLARFWVRRALKLYPSFYLMMVATLIYCLGWHFQFTLRDLAGELTLTQNYVGSIWGHTWSLAVEEHFYLLLPLALFLMMRMNPGSANPFRSVPYVFVGVAIICLGLRVWNAMLFSSYDHHLHYEPSHLRIDSLLFGVFLSYLHNFHSSILAKLMSAPWRMPLSFLSILALAPTLLIPFDDSFVYVYGFTSIYIGFGIVLLLSIYKEKRGVKLGFVSRAIGAMGVYSYTIYLWHVPIAMLFAPYAARITFVNPYVLHTLYLALSIGTGIAASKLVEIPILKLRERFFPSGTFGVATVLESAALPQERPALRPRLPAH